MDEKKKKDGRKLYILKKKNRNLMSQYFYNFSQKILNSRLLSTITTGKKKTLIKVVYSN